MLLFHEFFPEACWVADVTDVLSTFSLLELIGVLIFLSEFQLSLNSLQLICCFFLLGCCDIFCYILFAIVVEQFEADGSVSNIRAGDLGLCKQPESKFNRKLKKNQVSSKKTYLLRTNGKFVFNAGTG